MIENKVTYYFFYLWKKGLVKLKKKKRVSHAQNNQVTYEGWDSLNNVRTNTQQLINSKLTRGSRWDKSTNKIRNNKPQIKLYWINKTYVLCMYKQGFSFLIYAMIKRKY